MILKTKYFDLETDTFSFKEPESIRNRLENSFKNCFTDKPSTNLAYECGPFKISLKYEPTRDYYFMPFPIDSNDLIFSDVGCIKGYKIMDDDYTCRKFHYEPNHSYFIDEDPIPCERGFHFCKELADCFNYYQPSTIFDRVSYITYDLDVLKFLKVKSNGTTYKLGDKYCTNNITILEECTTEEVLEAFTKLLRDRFQSHLNFKFRGDIYKYYEDELYEKLYQNNGASNEDNL